MKRVLIVEDQRMPRENMERMLSDSGRYELAASLSGADIAFVKCCQQHIDLILMDVCTSGSKDGIEAAAEIKAKFPDIKIIIVTSMVEVSYLERARAAGVDSFWYKEADEHTILEVMERTMDGENVYPDDSPVVKIGQADSSQFTQRELQVLQVVTTGASNSVVAERLGLSENTVKSHIRSMLEKTGCSNRTELAIKARVLGIAISSDEAE